MVSSPSRDVRVFISSTFRDMHAERDYLVRTVFPELKERCREKRVRLVDVDLRWGVTEADAENGRALDICLDEIDTCRPYFLGILGHRYGWIPPGQSQSITALEIHHGVLHGCLPRQVVDLPAIIDDELDGTSLSTDQKRCLASCYPWEAKTRKYLLRDDLGERDVQTVRSVFERYVRYRHDRSFFFFRTESLTRRLAGENLGDFFDADPVDQDRGIALKKQIADARLPLFDYDDIESFGQLVLDTLWARIEADVDAASASPEEWLDAEGELHALFMTDRTRRFAGRQALLERMDDFCERDDEAPVLVITGEPGCGKSALMARFAERTRAVHPDWITFHHFVGASPASTSLRQLLRRLCAHLREAVDDPEDVPEDIGSLIELLPALLARAGASRPVRIVIDGVNQLESSERAPCMRWFPQTLPPGVRCVISTLPGEARDALLLRRITPVEETVTGLTASETRDVVEAYLKEIRHEFPNQGVELKFLQKVERGNPLYILTALEELRVFGTFEELGHRIDELPDTVPALFDQVLERIEGDFPPGLVHDFLVYLACGRHGMTAEELQTLLKGHAPKLDPDRCAPHKYPDMLWGRLYRAVGAHLVIRSGVIAFFHDQLKEAATARYLPTPEARESVHRAIADHLVALWREPHRRALEELPYQLVHARQWDALVRLLSDLEFIEAKHAAGLGADLREDFSRSLQQAELPADAHRPLHEMFAFVRAQSAVLTERPTLTFQQAANEPDDTAPALAAHGRVVTGVAPSNWLRRLNLVPGTPCSMTIVQDGAVSACAFSPDGSLIAAGSESGELRLWTAATGREVKSLFVDRVVSCSFSRNGQWILVGSLDGTLTLWDITSGSHVAAARWPPRGDDASPERGWLEAFVPLTLSHPRVTTFIGLHDRFASVWHGSDRVAFGEAEPWRELTGVSGAGSFETVADLVWAFSTDGNRFVNGGHEKYLQLFELELLDLDRSGRGLGLDDYFGWVSTMCKSTGRYPCPSAIDLPEITREELEWFARRATARGRAGPETARDLEDEPQTSVAEDRDVLVQGLHPKRLAVLVGHRQAIRCCAFSRDGAHIVSGSADATVKLWDGRASGGTWQQSGVREPIATCSGHPAGVEACAFSDDGRLILSGDRKGILKIWDTRRGKREDSPFRVYVGDRSAVVHDRRAGECSALSPHRDEVYRCEFSPDGRVIVSTSRDGTLKVWDGEAGLLLNTLGRTKGWDRGTFAFQFIANGRRLVTVFLAWSTEDDTLPYVRGEVFLADHPPFFAPQEWLLVNAGTGEQVGAIAARALRISADSEYVEAIDSEGGVTRWNALTGMPAPEHDRAREGHVIAGPPDARPVAAEGPIGAPLVEASGQFLAVRDPRDQRTFCEYALGGRCTSWGWHPEGGRLVAGNEWGELHLLRIEGTPTAR